MNPMFDFSAKEISMIQMSLYAIAQTTKHTIEEGHEAPEGFVETLESVINKLNQVVEARIKNDEQFEAIVDSLTDVEQSLNVIVNNPDVEIDEYH